jgi:hypothetical protein
VNNGAKIATMTQNRTIANPTIAILEANITASPAHMRLKIPGFTSSTLMGAVASSAVAMMTPSY